MFKKHDIVLCINSCQAYKKGATYLVSEDTRPNSMAVSFTTLHPSNTKIVGLISNFALLYRKQESHSYGTGGVGVVQEVETITPPGAHNTKVVCSCEFRDLMMYGCKCGGL